MSYSNKQLPNDPKIFPGPPLWLSWTARDSGDGTLRHYYTEAEARNKLRWVGSALSYRNREQGVFMIDWALYEWDATAGAWVERHSGRAGEARSENSLFRKRFKNATAHPSDEKLKEEAIAEIKKSMAALGLAYNRYAD